MTYTTRRWRYLTSVRSPWQLDWRTSKVYKEVPWWWYTAIFISCVAVALGTLYGAKSGMPWWALIFALFITAVFLPIIGTLYCTVGFAPSIANIVPVSPSVSMKFVCTEGAVYRWLAVWFCLGDLLRTCISHCTATILTFWLWIFFVILNSYIPLYLWLYIWIPTTFRRVNIRNSLPVSRLRFK